MSTAAAFKFPWSFPFCVGEISGDVRIGAAHLDDLTLSQVMAFAWNLEACTLTTTGSSTLAGNTADGDISLTLNPPFSSEMENGVLNDGSMWFGNAFSVLPWASWPSIRQPVERICNPVQTVAGTLLDLYAYNTGTLHTEASIAFWVGTDPVNSGKYRLYYYISITSDDLVLGTTQIKWSHEASISGMTAFNSGTITIGGLTFNWYSFYTSGSTPSGTGAMTASSTLFTY